MTSPSFRVRTIKGAQRPPAPGRPNELREPELQLLEPGQHDVSALTGERKQIFFADHVQDLRESVGSSVEVLTATCLTVAHLPKKDGLVRVSSPGVDHPSGMLRSMLTIVEDPAGHHLLGEGDNVGAVRKVEQLVAPHGAGVAPACLDLVHHQGNVVALAQSVQTLQFTSENFA